MLNRDADGDRTPPTSRVDFTMMYVVHDAFTRDLHRLTAAAGAGRAGPGRRSDRAHWMGDAQEAAAHPPHCRGHIAVAGAAPEGPRTAAPTGQAPLPLSVGAEVPAHAPVGRPRHGRTHDNRCAAIC